MWKDLKVILRQVPVYCR